MEWIWKGSERMNAARTMSVRLVIMAMREAGGLSKLKQKFEEIDACQGKRNLFIYLFCFLTLNGLNILRDRVDVSNRLTAWNNRHLKKNNNNKKTCIRSFFSMPHKNQSMISLCRLSLPRFQRHSLQQQLSKCLQPPY